VKSWTKTKLGAVGKVTMCKRVLKSQTTAAEGIPFFKISTFGGTAESYISEKLYDHYRRKYPFPSKGDILISAAGTLGKTVIYNGAPSYFQDSNIVWIANDESKILNSFLYYYYQTKPWQTTSGSTINRIYNEDLRSLEIQHPDLPTQNKIAAVLSALDAKIALNHRINTELEGMAKLLYDYWFVQYDFPLSAAQAAALGQPHLTGQPYRSSGGPMVFDPQLKREIPVIWSADNLLQLSELGGGGTPNTKNQEYWSGHIPFFTPTDAEPQPFKLTTEQKITLKGLENSSTKVYPKGTLFVTARGSVGKIMIIASDMAMNQSCYALCPHEGVNTPFLYFHALSLVNFLRTKSSGSIFKSIVTNDIKFSTTVIPDLETIESFGKIAEPLFSQILNNHQQNQELTTLRDWLLPMLMNGQVRVG
jgi:type I restriction enzyme S subunit